MATATLIENLRGFSRHAMLGVPLLLLALLMMLVVPLPPFMLDLFFTFNIALSLVVLLACVYTRRPLAFATFPTVLLVATLLRLALNIASTRVVLLNGHMGSDAAGRVIEAFGSFVIGGNFAVGLVVFAILVIINFVVITKGAGRISEVSARFTLDAMPGKQMAIDADLNAGVIDQDEARRRREDVVAEADFYGSMDGASKFVRGDAVAGLLVLFVTIFGGLAVGMAQHGLPLSSAFETYTLLTVGDGLVAQLPALLLSTGAAIMVTRVSSEQNMGTQVLSQLCESPRALGVAGGVLLTLGMIPGMPNLVFLLLGGGAAGASAWLGRRARAAEAARQAAPSEAEATAPAARDLGWEDVVPVDPIGLEVGYRLIPLVDRNQGGQLMDRIRGVRRKLTHEVGFLIPPVHIRDNLELAPNGYRITLLGVAIAEAEIQADRDLAINPGQVFGDLDGIATRDPAFGMDAVWIESHQREQAQTLGYTVVDGGTVIATHLSHIMRTHVAELLGREEVQQLLDALGRSVPRLVEGLVPEVISLGALQKVLRALLEEDVSLRDMRTIVETIAAHPSLASNADELTATVRVALGRMIVQSVAGLETELPVITLEPELEQLLLEAMKAPGGAGALEPGLAGRLHESLREAAERQEAAGQPVVLLVPATLRTLLSRFVRHSISAMHVLSYEEVPDNRKIRIVAAVGRPADRNPGS